MGEFYDKLTARLKDIHNLEMAAAVLEWDQQVNMPPQGAEARGDQLATLSRMKHELFIADETQHLVEQAAHEVNGVSYDSTEASLLRVVQHDLEQATKLPAEHVAEISRVTTVAHNIWAAARANNDFQSFESTLQQILDLTLQSADYLGYESNPYDALLDSYDRGMTTERVKSLFDGHKAELVDLISAISEVEDRVSDEVVHREFDLEKQRDFGQRMVTAFGFDFERGRQDVAVHPFMINFSRDDVRITTRFEHNFLNPALFGTMHEAGHGMYEQGISESLGGTVLAQGTSLSVHESQSRMWENLVGRSKGFWEWAYPQLQATFPDTLRDVDMETLYKASNKVEPSFIRVEADEATYNLHIMLRFELENDLINGRVHVADLPKEWNERFEAFLGIIPPTNKLGVLQDVHWSAGLIGYFPTYALGNLLSVQYYNAALQQHPNIPDEIASGKFDTLLTWLNENIHQHGRKYTTDELTKRATGQEMDSAPYIAYLRTKFGEIYDL